MSESSRARGAGARIAVDIGGTFVDAIAFDPGADDVRLAKVATTPAAPSEGVLEAVAALSGDLADLDTFIHGTTLGLNAVLTRAGATSGLITNAGFIDLLEIGRSDVPFESMYDFRYVRPTPLVPRRRIRGVGGRLDHHGRELEPLDEAAVGIAAAELRAAGCDSIAICFLHSYTNPDHERRAAAAAAEAAPGLTISASVDVAPEYREYERLSTTVVDAYVSPIFARYVDALADGLRDAGHHGRFLITRSAGGAMTADAAREAPSLTLLSGPAGGIIGATALSEAAGIPDIIAFDVGGTSLDTCVISGGRPTEVYQARIEQFPLLIPVYDIRTLGAGGGSIASVSDGLLQVGPASAGAAPGPVAYGRGGDRVTLTDAAIVLGHIDPDGFVGGSFSLDAKAAEAAVDAQVAVPLGRTTVDGAAAVLDVLLAKTVGAVREITVERGMDPADFALLAYGGAGPLLATGLAREMDIDEVVVPRMPAGFSAWGMLMADLEVDVARTILTPLDDSELAAVKAATAELAERADASLAAQEVAPEARSAHSRLDLRYLGQEHVLEIALGGDDTAESLTARFNDAHQARYGHRLESGVEIVTLRVRGVGALSKPSLPAYRPQPAGEPRTREAFDLAEGRMRTFAVHKRSQLGIDAWIEGPALVVEDTAVTVVHADQRVRSDAMGLLHVRGAA